jgi:hypothetical protein
MNLNLLRTTVLSATILLMANSPAGHCDTMPGPLPGALAVHQSHPWADAADALGMLMCWGVGVAGAAVIILP